MKRLSVFAQFMPFKAIISNKIRHKMPYIQNYIRYYLHLCIDMCVFVGIWEQPTRKCVVHYCSEQIRCICVIVFINSAHIKFSAEANTIGCLAETTLSASNTPSMQMRACCAQVRTQYRNRRMKICAKEKCGREIQILRILRTSFRCSRCPKTFRMITCSIKNVRESLPSRRSGSLCIEQYTVYSSNIYIYMRTREIYVCSDSKHLQLFLRRSLLISLSVRLSVCPL